MLDEPLASLHELESSLFGDSDTGLSVNEPASNVVLPVVAFLTPAAGELLLFFATFYFFLVGQIELRNHVVSMFGNRDAKLRFLKIMRDIERNLAGYLTVVTIVNAGLGDHRRDRRLADRFSQSGDFRPVGGLLNYVPYVGPAVMVIDPVRRRPGHVSPRSATPSSRRSGSSRSPRRKDISSRRPLSGGG